nr:diversity-generating retroelement protein bAvd family protein [Algoriphagus sp.]
QYISEGKRNELVVKSEEVGRMLNHMIENPEKYKPRNK